MQPYLWIWLLGTPIVYAVIDLMRMGQGTRRQTGNAARLAAAQRSSGR